MASAFSLFVIAAFVATAAAQNATIAGRVRCDAACRPTEAGAACLRCSSTCYEVKKDVCQLEFNGVLSACNQVMGHGTQESGWTYTPVVGDSVSRRKPFL
eukprot:TRINITY_DN877_c0_g1_i1.p2 TRINITY_DN877_c0_g1~~TRINITY_DN877_c0_g1_i1.p2  ORF type:complete len:114 (+),score=22.64 TRINITY_DN877_c0_g1_i1:44-343(+)